MGGQRRALVLATLLCALSLAGCAAQASTGMPCDIPDNAQLVAGDDGGYVIEYDNGETYGLAFANGACVFDPQVVAVERAERSDSDLRFIYDYYVLRLAPCLEEFGYGYFGAPSRDDFVASGGNWSPYDSVFTAMMSSSDITVLTQTCPELPPKLFTTH